MAYRLFNPDSASITVTTRNVSLVVPSHGYVIVSSIEGIADVYNTLGISQASDEELESFRRESAKLQKEVEKAAEEKAKQDAIEAKAEAKRIEIVIEAREKRNKEARAEALKVQIGFVKEQEETQANLSKSLAGYLPEVEKPKNRKAKK